MDLCYTVKLNQMQGICNFRFPLYSTKVEVYISASPTDHRVLRETLGQDIRMALALRSRANLPSFQTFTLII